MLYFLYDDLIDLCELGIPGDSVVDYFGIATLNDFKLSFRHRPTLDPQEGSKVFGALVHIDKEVSEKINQNYNCPALYTKRQKYISFNNREFLVTFYVQKFTKQLLKRSPPPEYLAELYQLYIQYGLPLNQINDAIAELDSSKYSVNI